MRRLGITADEAPTQIVGRDRIAEFTNLLALIAGTGERLSTEVRNLQRTEIGEVAEWFDESHQVGSSTMAQKRNPMLSENVTSLARVVRSLALPPLENMALWHERDLTNSASERIVIPHAVILTDDILRKLTDVFTRLVVDPARMARNLSEYGGAAMTESLMLALTQRGLARSQAHELLRTLTKDLGPGESLASRAKGSPEVGKRIPSEELDALLNPAGYVASAAEKTDRIVRALEGASGRDRPRGLLEGGAVGPPPGPGFGEPPRTRPSARGVEGGPPILGDDRPTRSPVGPARGGRGRHGCPPGRGERLPRLGAPRSGS